MSLKLKRPIAVIDLETTGANVETDQIVSIAIVKINTDNTIEEGKEWLVNPLISIPEAVSKIHGITDKMVKDKPTFRELAPKIKDELANCDLAGFNIDKFDLPLLINEFKRVEHRSSVRGLRLSETVIGS